MVHTSHTILIFDLLVNHSGIEDGAACQLDLKGQGFNLAHRFITPQIENCGFPGDT